MTNEKPAIVLPLWIRMRWPRNASYNSHMRPNGPRKHGARARPGVWLAEAERLFADFKELTPYPYRPFVRSFSSFAEYERWKRAQKNPWYR